MRHCGFNLVEEDLPSTGPRFGQQRGLLDQVLVFTEPSVISRACDRRVTFLKCPRRVFAPWPRAAARGLVLALLVLRSERSEKRRAGEWNHRLWDEQEICFLQTTDIKEECRAPSPAARQVRKWPPELRAWSRILLSLGALAAPSVRTTVSAPPRPHGALLAKSFSGGNRCRVGLLTERTPRRSQQQCRNSCP